MTNLTNLSRILLVSCVFSGAIALALAADKPLFADKISGFLGADVYKISLQFVLTTLFGGLVFFGISKLQSDIKEEKEKEKEKDSKERAAQKELEQNRQQKIQVLRDISLEISSAYRATKRLKRMMRAHLNEQAGRCYSFDSSIFLIYMGELQDAQISVEMLRDKIGLHSDLFENERYSNLDVLIEYWSRYLHDVFEEYEKKWIARDPSRTAYVITESGGHRLLDFLGMRGLPPSAKVIRSKSDSEIEIQDTIELIKNRNTAQPSPNLSTKRETNIERLRYGRIAMTAAKFAIREIGAQASQIRS